jgi:hypothetical protein
MLPGWSERSKVMGDLDHRRKAGVAGLTAYNPRRASFYRRLESYAIGPPKIMRQSVSCGKASSFSSVSSSGGSGFFFSSFCLEPPRQELLHEPTDLVGVLDGVEVVRARSLEHLLKVVRGARGRRLLALALSSGHERVTGPWLVLLLLFRVVGGAFVGVLKAWLVAMPRSSLVVHGLFCPSL